MWIRPRKKLCLGEGPDKGGKRSIERTEEGRKEGRNRQKRLKKEDAV
jgi:hypothetical protein